MEDPTRNYWGRYQDKQPSTHYDPLQSFLVDGRPVGFRVNFLPDRGRRPREQSLSLALSKLQDPIEQEEKTNSPLYRVMMGLEPCIPIAADDHVLGDPDDEDRTQDFSEYGGLSIMNKFSPLGIQSQEATGVALVNYPTTYIRTLSSARLNFQLLLPMQTALSYLIEGRSYRNDISSPVAFFNIGPSSGSSLKYLHSQCYAMPETNGLLTHAYKLAFESNAKCLTCEISKEEVVEDHLGQTINYSDLTVWEDEFNRVIVPYAPFRTMGTRIVPKFHLDYLGNASTAYLASLANSLTVADYLMNAAIPNNRTPQPDRTIPFRQTSQLGDDFHMFIDMYPPFPILAAESAEFLGLSPFHPNRIVERMKSVNLESLELIQQS